MAFWLKKLIFCGCALAVSHAMAFDENAEPLASLKDLIKKNREQLEWIDKSLHELLSDPSAKIVSAKKDDFDTQMQKLRNQRHELSLRQEFLDRLIFRVDSHYKVDADLKDFFFKQISEMAEVEASEVQGDPSLWKFLTYLSMALKTQVERSENIVAFIEGYMKFSSISSPTKPEDYVRLRSYTNGKDSYAAKPIAVEAIGEIVEKRMKQISGSITTQAHSQ